VQGAAIVSFLLLLYHLNGDLFQRGIVSSTTVLPSHRREVVSVTRERLEDVLNRHMYSLMSSTSRLVGLGVVLPRLV
jgi:hypothetical protein